MGAAEHRVLPVITPLIPGADKTLGERGVPRILQVFNRYVHYGGEEGSVDRISVAVQRRYDIMPCMFASADWLGNQAPAKWRQPLLTLYNPASVRRLRIQDDLFRPHVWLFHNVFPVGSAGLYREALLRKKPVMYYVHNFRPFSVNGYLWNGRRVTTEGGRLNYWPEILAGSWQGSRLRTLFLASVFWFMHSARWWRSIKVWIAISEFMRDFFIDAGIPDERICVLRHYWPITGPPQNVGDDGYYLFLGRMMDAKGVLVALEAWKILKDRLGDATPELVLAGEGPLRPMLEGLNQPRVRYAGFISGETKSQLVGRCRAMLAPSIWWEPLGVVTYEAYAAMKPMLAARSGGLTETVQEGLTGFIHTPGDAAELAGHVEGLEKEPERAAAMGRAGYDWLMKNTGEDGWLDSFGLALQMAVDAGR